MMSIGSICRICFLLLPELTSPIFLPNCIHIMTSHSLLDRILDNLPLVMPIKRGDQDAPVYQLGYYVGLKGLYAGVSIYVYSIKTHS